MIGGSAGSPRPVGGVVRLQEVDLDVPGRLVHPHQPVIVERGLLRAAVDKRRLLRHHGAHAVDDRALHLVHRVQRVDDLAADVGGDPHLVHLHAVLRVHGDFGDLREVPEVRVKEGDAHAGALRQLALAPAGLLGGEPQYAFRALCVEVVPRVRQQLARRVEQREAELDRVLA